VKSTVVYVTLLIFLVYGFVLIRKSYFLSSADAAPPSGR
jgi:hypothetical protein